MRTRTIAALVLAVLALPLLILGLIDPLEGGLALIAAIVLGVIVRLLSREPFPRFTWISVLTALGIGALVLGIALLRVPQAGPDGSVPSPLSGGLVALLWVYRVAVLVAIAGAVVYVLRVIRAVRREPR